MFKEVILVLIVISIPGYASASPPAELAKQVEIFRDEWGVPHINGKTDESVIFAVAYAQCEDYFWQVEDTYLFCIGKYGLAYGEKGLESDRIHALFEIERMAKETYAIADPQRKMVCDAYAAGYNYYLETHPEVSPRIIDHFEPHYLIQYERFMILQRMLGRAHAPKGGLEPMLEEMAAATGSNAWAISGEKTQEGAAMLFINPHQPWYGTGSFTEMHVVSDEGWNFSGCTFPGGPFPSMGHNEYLGWAHTVNDPDVADVYRLTFDDPEEPLNYRYDDGYRTAESWEDTLQYVTEQGVQEKTYTFRKSHFGPIIAREDDEQFLAVKIPKLHDGNRTKQYIAMTKAKNFDEWYEAQSMLQMQMFNTVYADVDGNIFYLYGGTVPRRNEEVDWTEPVDGSNSENEWNGFHPIEELPQVLNPISGFVQNCNQSPFTTTDDGNPSMHDFPSYLAEDKHSDKRRAKMSRLLLRNATDVTFDNWQNLCYDTQLYWPMTELPRYERWFEELNETHPELAHEVKPFLDHLLAWDCESRADSTATTLCVAWYEELYGRGYPSETMNQEYEESIEARFRGLVKAAKTLHAVYGDWKIPYGEIFRLQRWPNCPGPEYVPFDDTKPSLPQVGVRGPLGVAMTVYHTPPVLDQPNRRKQYACVGASYMAAISFGDKIQTGSYLHYGQSGDPGSPHFFDQAKLLSEKKFKPAWFYWEDVLAHTVDRYRPGRRTQGSKNRDD